MRGKIIGLVVVFLAAAFAAHADGICETHTFPSAALGEERQVSVYLPEGYAPGGPGFPVVYWHGHSDSCWPEELRPKIEGMIGDELIDPVVVVFFETFFTPFPDDPDVGEEVSSSLILNSKVAGNFRDYVVGDLIPWVDGNFNTVPERSRRFLTGHSINAYGTWRLALERSDLFSKLSGMQGLYEWSHLQNFSLYVVSEAQAAGELPSYDFALSNGWFTFMVHAFSSILLPNDNGPPWYDFPLDSDGKLIDALFQQIFEQDIYAIVEREAANAEDLELYFDVGLQDNTVPGHAENLAAALDGLGWPYVFHTYPGGHGGDDFVLHRIWVHVTHFMPIKATAEISPRVADPRLYPQRLRVAVELPGDLEVDDIDCSTLSLVDIDGSRLDCPIGCSSACEISDVNGNGRDDLSVWLPCDATVRAAIEGGAEPGDQVELTVRGELDDGRFFAATDTVTLGSGLVAVAAVD